MGTGFWMNGNYVSPGLGERIEEWINRRDHQVNVERLWRVRAKRFHDPWPDGEIGDEMAVHDVDMDPVAACVVDRAHFLAKFREVGG